MEKVVNLSIDDISEPKIEFRQIATQEGLEELAGSIKRMGLIEPIIVTPHENRYEVVSGWRRWKAAQMAGKATIRCIIVKKRPREIFLMRIHENLYRENVDDISQAVYFKYIQSNFTLSNEDLARLVGKSKAYVEQRLRILRADEATKAALAGGQINFTVARELIGIPALNVRERFLRYAVERGANYLTVREWKRNFLREQRKTERLEREGLPPLPPGPIPPLESECSFCKGKFPQEELITLKSCGRCFHVIKEEEFILSARGKQEGKGEQSKKG